MMVLWRIRENAIKGLVGAGVIIVVYCGAGVVFCRSPLPPSGGASCGGPATFIDAEEAALAAELRKAEMKYKTAKFNSDTAALEGRAPAFGGFGGGVTAAGAPAAPAVANGLSDAVGVGKSGASPGAGGTVAPTSAARGKYKTKVRGSFSRRVWNSTCSTATYSIHATGIVKLSNNLFELLPFAAGEGRRAKGARGGDGDGEGGWEGLQTSQDRQG